ncbi:Glycosyltransferase involved in cell wall bisynthesis [Malonomonas rubra DSM 5091]|uniref:Glycosyltransferase involved in cell wall bisynthesis n=1 Tax=Malonomonas rubra DSM 5091 TaxID=1122189 RepID=A0A1M6K1E0_MALRU|nr:glycosyltransferase family 4 protein [Malonomonas rubra]SHJ52700.1 Glycosyltransferase involved in cell wall bisynthesis [Malonomonas rubra DSM 5091]
MPERSPLKILHILSQLPAATGSGVYLQALLNHAELHGYHNYLLAGVPGDYESRVQLKKLASHDYCVVQFEQDLPFPIVGMSDVMPYPSTRFSELTASDVQLYQDCFSACLEDAVKRWQPDLIHSHHLWLLTSLARQRCPQIPMLVSCHGSDLRQFVNCRHLQQEVLQGCRKVDAVCALSGPQKEDIHQLYGIDAGKIHIVGAGYDRKKFSPSTAGKSGRLQIIYAGKLSRAKGVPWLLKALLPLEEDFIFHLVGDSDGHEKQDILQLAEQLGQKVMIHGNLEQQELAVLMRQSDLFVLPSFFEGLPLVLLEALASGCRLVTTALPGVVELFGNLNSPWIELVNLPKMAGIDSPAQEGEEVFISALRRALQAQIRSLKKERNQSFPTEIQSLLEEYSWGGIFSKIETLYNQLLLK